MTSYGQLDSINDEFILAASGMERRSVSTNARADEGHGLCQPRAQAMVAVLFLAPRTA